MHILHDSRMENGEHSAHQDLNDRMNEGGPLCAEVLSHRGIPEGYPVVIQSLLLICQEERSN